MKKRRRKKVIVPLSLRFCRKEREVPTQMAQFLKPNKRRKVFRKSCYFSVRGGKKGEERTPAPFSFLQRKERNVLLAVCSSM